MKLFSFVPGTTAWRKRRYYVLCMQATERIQQVVDGELPASRKTRILERHLVACRRCKGEVTAILELKAAIARVSCEADPEVVAKLETLARRLCEGQTPEL
jgi:anti-sigma factor RsiW